MSTDGPRIAPLPKEHWTPEAVATLRATYGDALADRFLSEAPDAPRIPNVLGTLLRNPGLTGSFLVFNNALLTAPTLERRQLELMVLRVAWRTRSTYEWAQHARLAERFDISREEVEAIGRGSDAGIWTPLEALLLAATDQLIDSYRIDDQTWERLAEHLDERQLMEVPFVVGTYTCLAMAFNTYGIEVDPEIDMTAIPALPD